MFTLSKSFNDCSMNNNNKSKKNNINKKIRFQNSFYNKTIFNTTNNNQNDNLNTNTISSGSTDIVKKSNDNKKIKLDGVESGGKKKRKVIGLVKDDKKDIKKNIKI